MKRIGFLANPTGTKKKPTKTNSANRLLSFDSGNGISFEDARHHTLAMGTTGSGKTGSVVLPALKRLVAAGHCGLVVDIKGNLREQVRAFAQHCGRMADVVELGSAPSAMPLNLMNGMAIHDVRSFIEALTMQHFQSTSHNKDFHMKGVHQAADCIQLLRYLTVLDAAFDPSLKLLAEVLDDYDLASKVFGLFASAVYDDKYLEHRRFMQRIKNSEFHVLSYSAKKARSSRTYFEQVNYALEGTRIALDSFMDAPGIARGFASQGRQGLDMCRLLKEQKVILLRFGPETGATGADLARVVLREYYKAVFATGLNMPETACPVIYECNRKSC